MHRPQRIHELIGTLAIIAILLGAASSDAGRTMAALRGSMAGQAQLLRSRIAGARHGLGLAIVIYKLSYPSTASTRQRPPE